MNTASITDRLSATLFRVRHTLDMPDSPRITPLSFRHVPGIISADVPDWVRFKPLRLTPGWMGQVGVVTLDKSKVAEAMAELPDAKLGVARAVGNSAVSPVVFGDWPPHVLLDLEPNQRAPEFSFGIRVNKKDELVRVAPALLTPDGELHVVQGITGRELTTLDEVQHQARVRVF